MNKNISIIALQDASISLLPMILTVTLLLMAGELMAFFIQATWVDYLRNIHRVFYVFFPLIFTVSLAIALAKSHDLDANSMVLLSVALLLLLIIGEVNTFAALQESTYFKVLPIPLTLITAKTFKYCAQQSGLHLFKDEPMALHIKRNFNLIIPAFITFILVLSLFLLLHSIWQTFSASGMVGEPVINDTSSVANAILLKFIFKLTWFFGVNPSHILAFLQAPYHSAFTENQMAFAQAAEIPHVITSGLYLFTDMGGAGAVWCLLLAILLFSQSKQHQRVARLSLLPSTFNISEIIHYGLPIVFNPYMFVPFILVPIVLFLNTFLFIALGWVSPVVESVPWTTPPLINSYLATGGDWLAVVLQLFNLAVGTLIYLKFLRLLEASHINQNLMHKFVNKFNLESKNIQALQYRNQQSLIKNLNLDQQINAALSKIDQGKLLLYYQPITCARSNKISHIEALIRLQDSSGQIHQPDFITPLSKAGLSTDIDRWVIQQVVKQSNLWPDSFNEVHININISPTSLLCQSFTADLIKLCQQAKHGLLIEILENQAVFEEQTINQHLKLLKNNKIQILLDDFGSGYSALAMLSRLNIDGVKYDINFAEQLNSTEGQQLLRSCLQVSQTLNHLTVLEGIETAEQFDLAQQSGVDLLQGFYISKPLPADRLVTFMQNRQRID